MRAGEHLLRVAVGVECVFHDIVARDAGGVDEKLPNELRQIESRPDFLAVQHERAVRRPCLLLPLGKLLAGFIIEVAPEADVLGAIRAPVVRADKPCVMAAALAEEHEIGREIQRGKIMRAVA